MGWRIRVQGFKTRGGPNYIRLRVAGVTVNVWLTAEDDSNTFAEKLAQAIQAAGGCATVPSIEVVQPATATVNARVVASVQAPIGDAPPQITLARDGTEPSSYNISQGEPIESAQVDGIFAARGRLGAWDEDNATYWSAYDDLMDFTPSLETQANVLTADAIKGRILKVSPHPEGFIIHATGSTILATYTGDQFVFAFKFLGAEGITNPFHVSHSSLNPYGIDKNGLYVIDIQGKAIVPIASELVDFLGGYVDPISIRVIGDRYLVVNTGGHNRAYSDRDIRRGARSFNSYVYAIPPESYMRPFNPTPDASYFYSRGIIYDLSLKKWGSADIQYQALFSLSPINQPSYNTWKRISFYTGSAGLTGIAGIDRRGEVLIYTHENPDSYLLMGKLQLSRRKHTQLTEVYTEYADLPRCYVSAEPATEDDMIDFDSELPATYITTKSGRHLLRQSARWFNVKVRGTFHIIYASIGGYINGLK